jgi:hypothetical protein
MTGVLDGVDTLVGAAVDHNVRTVGVDLHHQRVVLNDDDLR